MPVSTLLPIYTFAKVLGLHPLHFMQVDTPSITGGASRVCVHPIMQYSWQASDGVSRDELSLAIYESEVALANELGYWPAPLWTVDERQEMIQPYNRGTWARGARDIRGDMVGVKANYGEMISGGIKAKTLVGANAVVVYTDTDSDLYFETATILAPTTVTDPEEIAVYYPGLSGDDEWEIRPITVSISGGTATITCRREQLVRKVLLEGLEAAAVNGQVNGNFLTDVDVYRKYNDPSVQAQLVWRNVDCCACGLGNSEGCESCTLTVQTGCLTTKDKGLSLVSVSSADWDTDDLVFEPTSYAVCGRRPDYVRLWYRSGLRDMGLATPNLTMRRDLQMAVAHLAISKLDRLICSCKAVSDVQSHWNVDLRRSSASQAQSASYRVTNYELENCPFGSTVGALDAWRLVKRISSGVIPGGH